MSADVNYTVKRLVRGLASDSHQLKKGFFLALSQVLDRFKKQTDCQKLIKFMAEECKTNKGMKNPEINALAIGKLMCLSAIVETGLFQSGAVINHDALNAVVNELM